MSVLELPDKGWTLLIWICSGWKFLVTSLVAAKESWTHGRSLLSWRPRFPRLIRRPEIQNLPVTGAKTQMLGRVETRYCLGKKKNARQVIVRTISLTTSTTGWLQQESPSTNRACWKVKPPTVACSEKSNKFFSITFSISVHWRCSSYSSL